MEQLRRFWRKNARLSDAVEEVRFGLVGAHKVAAVDELAALLVARHGSQLLAESDRLAAAVPVIRALAEAQDPTREEVPLMALNRVEGSSVILLAEVGDAEAMVAEVLMAATRTTLLLGDRRGLVLAADPRRLDDAAAWLSESFGVQVVDVAGELIRAAKASAGRLKAVGRSW